MEWIDTDELVEVTPDAIRVRKAVLRCNHREERTVAMESAQRVTSPDGRTED